MGEATGPQSALCVLSMAMEQIDVPVIELARLQQDIHFAYKSGDMAGI